MDPTSEKQTTTTPPDLAEKEKGSPSPPISQDESALALLQQIKSRDISHPIHWPVWKKWVIVSIYCLLQIFVTLTSTTYVSAEFLVQEKFGGATQVSMPILKSCIVTNMQQVIALGQSMFIVGNAVGPAFLGPLSYVPLNPLLY